MGTGTDLWHAGLVRGLSVTPLSSWKTQHKALVRWALGIGYAFERTSPPRRRWRFCVARHLGRPVGPLTFSQLITQPAPERPSNV